MFVHKYRFIYLISVTVVKKVNTNNEPKIIFESMLNVQFSTYCKL